MNPETSLWVDFAPKCLDEFSNEMGLVQRTVIVQKDRFGYGLTVTGNCPVTVQQVKENSAAFRAGIKVGDRIIKVNGALTTKLNHTEVVSLIRSGPYAALTLLGRSASKLRTSPLCISSENFTQSDDTYKDINHCKSANMQNIVLAAMKKQLPAFQEMKTMHEEENRGPQNINKVGKGMTKIPFWYDIINKHRKKIFELHESLIDPQVDMVEPPISSDSNVGQVQQIISNSNEIKNQPFEADSDSTMNSESQGVFSDLSSLVLNPNQAPLTVFLNYLLLNSEVANLLFFYLFAEDYKRKKADRSDLQRWAYELHSTFTLKQGPLFIGIPYELQDNITKVLDAAEQTKIDESILRHLFDDARKFCCDELSFKYLPEYRHQKTIGLSALYGDFEIPSNADRSTQLYFIEYVLSLFIEKNAATKMEENETSRAEYDENVIRSLTNSCIVTYMKRCDIRRCSKFDINSIDCFLRRERSLLFKNQQSNKKLSGKEKLVKNHSLSPKIVLKPSKCSFCHVYLSGLSPQGYVCMNCNILLDAFCAQKGELNDCQKIPRRLRSNRFFSRNNPSLEVSVNEVDVVNIQDPLSRGNQTSVQRSKSDRWPRDKVEKSSGKANGRSSSNPLMGNYTIESMLNHAVGLEPQACIPSGELSANQSSDSNLKNSRSTISSACESSEHSFDDSDLEVDANALPPVESFIDVDVLKSLSTQELKRQVTLVELYHTERTHLKNLKILKTVFKDRLSCLQCISSAEIQRIFPNLEKLISLHTSFKNALKECRENSINHVITNVAEVILSHFDGEIGKEFAMECAIFLQDQSYTVKLIRQKETVPEFSTCLKIAESNPLCRKLCLKDFLPCVMSRISKYKLLFQQIRKYTDNNNPKEKELLTRCVECAIQLNVRVNEAVREKEHQNLINKIKSNLFINFPPDYDICDELKRGYFDFNKRKLIYNSTLIFQWPLKDIEFEGCLFEDLLVLFRKIPISSSSDKSVATCDNYHYILQNHKVKRDHSDMEFVVCPVMNIDQFMLKKKAGLDNRAFFLVSKGKMRQFLIELRANSKEDCERWFMYVDRVQAKNKLSHDSAPLLPSDVLETELPELTEPSDCIARNDEDIPEHIQELRASENIDNRKDIQEILDSIKDYDNQMLELMKAKDSLLSNLTNTIFESPDIKEEENKGKKDYISLLIHLFQTHSLLLQDVRDIKSVLFRCNRDRSTADLNNKCNNLTSHVDALGTSINYLMSCLTKMPIERVPSLSSNCNFDPSLPSIPEACSTFSLQCGDTDVKSCETDNSDDGSVADEIKLEEFNDVLQDSDEDEVIDYCDVNDLGQNTNCTVSSNCMLSNDKNE